MALHGEIKVNGHIIGYWEATRVETDDFAGHYEYKCRVTLEETLSPLPTDPWAPIKIKNHDLNFYLWHKYEDGALSLAAAVLKHAFKEKEKVAA